MAISKGKLICNAFILFTALLIGILSNTGMNMYLLLSTLIFACTSMIFTMARPLLEHRQNPSFSLRLLFYIVIISSYFGAFLSLPGTKYISVFRVSLLLLIITFIYNLIGRKKMIQIDSLRLYYIFLKAWIFISLSSIAWSRDIVENIKYNLFLLVNLIIIMLFPYFFYRITQFKLLFMFLFIIYLINIGFGLFEVNTGMHIATLHPYYLETWVVHSPYTFFNNINETASYLTLYLPLAYIPCSRNKKTRYLFFIVCILAIFLIVSTSSRTNYISLLIEFILLLTLNKDLIKIKEAAAILLIAISILIIICTQNNIFVGPFLSRLKYDVISIFEFFTDTVGSNSVRRQLILSGFLVSVNTALLGTGAGNSKLFIYNMNNPLLENVNTLHSWWIELLSNYGIFVFIGFLLFYGSILKELLAIIKNAPNEDYRLYAKALFISLFAFVITSFSSSSIIEIVFQWILFGMSLALINAYAYKYNTGNSNDE